MIQFLKTGQYLILSYTPELVMPDIIYKRLENNESYMLRHTFHLGNNNLYDDTSGTYSDDSISFIIGELVNDYYKIERHIIATDFDLFLYRDIPITEKLFIASRNISIFRKFSKIYKSDIYIGGSQGIPYAEFIKLIKLFPNSTELDKYTEARLDTAINDFLDIPIDYVGAYHSYMNRKISSKKIDLAIDAINQYEIEKYECLLAKLKAMLKKENEYTEKQWQSEILKIIVLLFPKYIRVFSEVGIKDIDSDKVRRLDYMLVDINGAIDLIEIKKPSYQQVLSTQQYRDNYIPRRDLSGTFVQVDKYIYQLNRWGKYGEDTLTEKFAPNLPNGFRIQIRNPKAYIIAGRSNDFNKEQLCDFEIIRRTYHSIIDIITYDDLLTRLENLIYSLQQSKSNPKLTRE